MIFLLFLLLVESCHKISAFDEKNAIDYLLNYGYINNSSFNSDLTLSQQESSTVLSDALTIFQEYYNLEPNGILNNETIDIMKTSRCGLSDDIYNLNLIDQKWNKTHITWNYFLANNTVINLTQKAFQLWSDVSGLTFEYSKRNADIIISNQRGGHKFIENNQRCSPRFDGPGNVLAHAFFPLNDQIREIHIDVEEDWSLIIDEEDPDKKNLFQVLVHEIGHALGLRHTNNREDIMFAIYKRKWNRILSDMDAENIEHLYGENKVETSTTVTSTQNILLGGEEDESPNLCSLKQINRFLILNDGKMLIVYQNWLWILPLDDLEIKPPIKLTDLLSFVPRDFKEISAMYQRSNDDILIIIDNLMYMIGYPSLQLMADYPKPVASIFPSRYARKRNIKIQAIFITNSGKTLLIYDNFYVAEISECSLSIIKYRLLSEMFPDIPRQMDGAFRFTNGRLYFFKKNMFYEYDEYRKLITKIDLFNLSIFNIKCLNFNVFDQLSAYLNEIKMYFVHLNNTVYS